MTLWGALMAPASRLDDQNKSGRSGRPRLAAEGDRTLVWQGRARQGRREAKGMRRSFF